MLSVALTYTNMPECRFGFGEQLELIRLFLLVGC